MCCLEGSSMGKKIFLCCVMVLLMEAAVDPLEVFAEGDPLASPTPRTTQLVAAPVISGVNPQVTLPEGDLGDINPSGGSFPQGPFLLGDEVPPTFLDMALVATGNLPGLLGEDVSCGPAALAEALRLLKKDSYHGVPDARELEYFLREWGLMYTWGTGVEELAYAAKSYGFPGAQAAYNVSLQELVRVLEEGNPLIVQLGVNGPDRPGHFMVLTSISSDGNWITCVDPRQGTLQFSREEFSTLWELQGRAGVVFMDFPPPASADSIIPWMRSRWMLRIPDPY